VPSITLRHVRPDVEGSVDQRSAGRNHRSRLESSILKEVVDQCQVLIGQSLRTVSANLIPRVRELLTGVPASISMSGKMILGTVLVQLIGRSALRVGVDDDVEVARGFAAAGQPAVNYVYDNAHRLTSITQGTATVSSTYDNADRRTTLTYANGIVAATDYDAVNRLASVTCTLGQATLGALTYTYDAAGNRTSVDGSWAAVRRPGKIWRRVVPQELRVSRWARRHWLGPWPPGRRKRRPAAADWILGSHKNADTWLRQMEQRGWTTQQIADAIRRGAQFEARNFVNPGNPAIRYVNPATGRSVVVDAVTRQIIHVSGDGFRY
jgi:YD repeat-containing protein